MQTRREFLNSLLAASSSAALSAAGIPAVSWAADEPAAGAGAALTALLDEFFIEDLQRSPERATQLGLDKGALAGLRGKLSDHSLSGIAASKAQTADQLKRLKQLGRAGLTGIDAVNYDCVAYVLEQRDHLNKRYDFGAPWERSPYCISQLTGAYQSLPTFLDTKHRIDGPADVETYLARMEAFATSLDNDTEALMKDSGRGIIPPDFILDTALTQLEALATPAESSVLVTSLAKRAAQIPGDHLAQAKKIYDEKISPALEKQWGAVKQARAKAKHDAGVWHIKEGDSWYADYLQVNTTTSMTPDQIHRMGLDHAAELTAKIDAILREQGMTQGSVGDRIKGLYTADRTYPDNDEGKIQLVADLQARLDAVVARLPAYFHDLPKSKAVVQRVPAVIEAGAPLAYYQQAALDGSRPATIYFNLKDSKEWPKWALPSTLYHEGMPGHHLQVGLAQETAGLPRYRANMFFSGYGEGWALYAEQLADEMGVYENDPLARVGYLKDQMFRAGRLVIDTGMHAKKWSREKAVAYMVGLLGDTESATTREVDRYCTWPGQACSYKIGHAVWSRLRSESQAALGDRFDIRDFHRAGLAAGAMPLDILARVIGDFDKQKMTPS
jgi:uncharacterized protein (DUF885 family)